MSNMFCLADSGINALIAGELDVHVLFQEGPRLTPVKETLLLLLIARPPSNLSLQHWPGITCRCAT